MSDSRTVLPAAAEQHPGQHNGGNPHTTNPCESDNNNPNCPGGF
jgi:hypothetical protein